MNVRNQPFHFSKSHALSLNFLKWLEVCNEWTDKILCWWVYLIWVWPYEFSRKKVFDKIFLNQWETVGKGDISKFFLSLIHRIYFRIVLLKKKPLRTQFCKFVIFIFLFIRNNFTSWYIKVGKKHYIDPPFSFTFLCWSNLLWWYRVKWLLNWTGYFLISFEFTYTTKT